MKINYGEKEIEFHIKYKKRKSVKISVKPDLEVEILAPLETKDEKIKEIVLKRASWILKQKDYFKKFLPRLTPRYYVSGETHRYLGRQYRLKVVAAEKNDVKLKGRFIYINTIQKYNRDYNKDLFYKWYRDHAEKKFEEFFEECYEKLRKYDIKKPTWSIRKMKSRWGSYNPINNHIILNIELIKVSSYGIKYVIMHELCHIKHPNHSKEFYRFMDVVIPDWKVRKEKLENTII
ncbi:M48 family metallopeptidase [Clostridium botulinum]|uniref:M48 family metallopeptidase n=1 Tax=Clostridium botulinum TaxID=1491 RepID=A0A6M0V3P9_CLOBO|nr:SprT family zinc-dependent metalloprotease [Clostridium botulinum]MCS6112586.1 M48 family peptidase [Clostridium botulinum]NFE13095.1 M48 family metallopeptidase [Clostridium botulinum]NFE61237.1 M48 family metallopeptidase [Clostridium botulinum]NFF87294.1 M48 family metallopeptidase [Clostridium botulinum]NFG11345.1 M48 family metallopeptidase [Clostridium botulinum]